MITKTPAAAIGVILCLALGPASAAAEYVYPARGQSAKKQAADEAYCSSWATKQSGFDPATPAPSRLSAKVCRSLPAGNCHSGRWPPRRCWC